MVRYTTDGARPGLVALYDIRPGNGAGQFLQPQSPHGAQLSNVYTLYCDILPDLYPILFTLASSWEFGRLWARCRSLTKRLTQRSFQRALCISCWAAVQ